MSTTACRDWSQRLVNRQSIIPAPIYKDEAEYALSIFKQLRVTDLPGKPTFGECSEDWVFEFVAAVFGGCDPETRRQQIREYFLLISKKNTKSTIAAGIMLTALILCWRDEEEHLILAPTKEVADNSFRPAAGMIRADDELMKLFTIRDHYRMIVHKVTKSSLKVVAADTDTVSGKKAGKIFVDELWLFGKRSNADAMFMEALGGQVSRPEGWVIYATTQSDEPPLGVFKEKLNYFRDVRDGRITDPKSLPVLYEFPQQYLDDKKHLDPANFYITNPNIGRSVSVEWLTDNLNKLKDRADGSLQRFLAKHLNVEIGAALRNDRWTGADFWLPCASHRFGLEELLDNSEVVTVGIDGGGMDDLLALAVIGRSKHNGKWLHWCHAWANKVVLDRRKSEITRFRQFVQDGDLTIVDQVGDDTAQLVDYCVQVFNCGLMDKIGCDPHGLGSILDELAIAGVDEEVLVGVSQGWKLTSAIKTLERKLASGDFVHPGSAMMTWALGNAKIELRGNAVMITKQASGVAKIDPLSATLNAVSLMQMNPQSLSVDNFIADPLVL